MNKLKLKVLVAILIFGIAYNTTAQERPNIIFILTDDQSYGMMGCTGNEIVQTPHLDQLASEGILFENAHITSAICTPSRISILLSQFERKHGVNFNSGTSVSEEAWESSYPMLMRKAGYYTGWVGKNHAPVGEGGYESGLMEESFDYWYAGHGHLSFYPKNKHKIFEDAEADTQVEVINEGVDDFLDTNEGRLKGAIRFLDKRPADQPFLLSINFNLPHSNGTGSMMMKPEDDEIYKSLYRNSVIPLPPHYVAKDDIKNPKLPADLLKVENRQTSYDFVDTEEKVRERYIRQLQSMTGVDRLVGNLRKRLQSLDLDENTVIIFTSDHGLFMGEYGLGGKALVYEKTTHVPMIIYNPKWPNKLKGRRSDALVQSIDVAPTMLAMADVASPSTFQGRDLSLLLDGGGEEVRKYVFTENLWSTAFGNPRCEAIQTKDWKYIRYYKNENLTALEKIKAAKQLGLKANQLLYGVHDADMALYRYFAEASVGGEPPVYEELYHLKTDPMEAENLIGNMKHKAILGELKSAWKTELKKARGEGAPKVSRYTVDSKSEKIEEKKDVTKTTLSALGNQKPNIIVVLTDDQGWADVGFNGGTDILTPNLDRLAGEGVVFSNGYVSHPYCSPSRAGLLTGRYQARFGHDCNISKDGISDNTVGTPLSEVMISEALKKVGYRTSAIGKWHLGDHPDLYPPNQGFDHWFGFAGGGMSYWGTPRGPERTVVRNGEPIPVDELSYLTDDFTNEAIRFIDDGNDEPFFMYLAYNAPHAPDHATAKYLEKTKHIEYGGRSIYAAMVGAVDAGVGRIDSTLVANGLKENTIIVFLSDNGGRTQHADNRPFRGHKGMLFEGGIKVPFFMTYPKVLASQQTYGEVISSLDLFPTLLAAAAPNSKQQSHLDGINLFPYLLGTEKTAPHKNLFWRSVGGFEYAVRSQNYKLYKSAYKAKTLLFDLEEDPYERKDIADQNPELIQKMEKLYQEWDANNLVPGWLDPHRENVLKEEKQVQALRRKSMGVKGK